VSRAAACGLVERAPVGFCADPNTPRVKTASSMKLGPPRESGQTRTARWSAAS